MRFFHVSRHDLGETVTMEVKLPWMCNIATEGDIPRICVSPIIHHCLRAVSSCVSNFTVNDALDHAKIETVFGESIEEYVERVPYIRGQSVYYTDERPFMPPASVDFRKNKEHWFLKNTEFKRAGYIDLDHLVNQRKVRVINDISEIESDVLLTLTQDVRITYTTNIVEAFRETKFKKGKQDVHHSQQRCRN